MESQFSNQMEAGIPNNPPAAPSISKVELNNIEALVTVKLPTVDEAGGGLTGLATLSVFVKDSSFEGSTAAAERAAGTTVFSVPVAEEQAGKEVVVSLTGLKYGPKYYFVASCDD